MKTNAKMIKLTLFTVLLSFGIFGAMLLNASNKQKAAVETEMNQQFTYDYSYDFLSGADLNKCGDGKCGSDDKKAAKEKSNETKDAAKKASEKKHKCGDGKCGGKDAKEAKVKAKKTAAKLKDVDSTKVKAAKVKEVTAKTSKSKVAKSANEKKVKEKVKSESKCGEGKCGEGKCG